MGPEGMEPDDKDWTWVLQKACPDCGFDAQTVSGRQVAAQLRANASRWPAVFERADVTARLQPLVWSPLEYGWVNSGGRRNDGPFGVKQ